MAPLKFEEHIKEKLEQRKLQPSADAWQKLNNQLDDDVSKKKNKAYWWLGIAASFIGVLLVVTVVMNSGNENTIKPTLVDTESTDPTTENEIIKEVIEEEKQELTKEKKIEEESPINNTPKESKQIKQKPSLLKQKIHTEQNKLVPTKTNDAVAQIGVNQKDEGEIEKVNAINTLTTEELKIQTVVAEIQKLQEQSKSSLDSELDALLNEAQQEIALEKLYKQAMKTVDADALLQGVEQDIDISFRDRVFKALKDSYKTVKTAVAERNN